MVESNSGASDLPSLNRIATPPPFQLSPVNSSPVTYTRIFSPVKREPNAHPCLLSIWVKRYPFVPLLIRLAETSDPEIESSSLVLLSKERERIDGTVGNGGCRLRLNRWISPVSSMFHIRSDAGRVSGTDNCPPI